MAKITKNKAAKKIFIFSAIAVTIILHLYLGIFIFLNIKGKNIVIKKIEKELGAKVEIESVTFGFPFNIKITNFGCGDVSFRKANISLGLSSIFAQKLKLNKVYLDGLKLKVTVQNNKIYIEPFLPRKKPELREKTVVAQNKNSISSQNVDMNFKKNELPFFVKKLDIKNSQAEISYLVKKNPVTIILEDITVSLRDFAYPRPGKFYIKFNSSLLPDSKKKKIPNALSANGWINYSAKAMDVDFKVNNFDYILFEGYYSDYWKPGAFKIKEALISLDSNFTSRNNDLTINSVLVLEKITFKEVEDGEDTSRMKTLKTIIAFFEVGKDKPTLHFKLKTKMNSPRLDFSSLKNVVKDSVQLSFGTVIKRVLDNVKKDVLGGFKKTGEVTVDAVVDTFKEVVDSIAEAFKFKAKDKNQK